MSEPLRMSDNLSDSKTSKITFVRRAMQSADSYKFKTLKCFISKHALSKHSF